MNPEKEEIQGTLLEAKEPGWLGRWLHNWQEPVVWLPILVLLWIGLFWAIPRLDPRSGIDGFGDLFHLVGAVIALAVIFFVAWLAKRTYFVELTDAQVESLQASASYGRSWPAVVVLLIDRLEWLGLLGLAYLVLRG